MKYQFTDTVGVGSYMATVVDCPKHGTHSHTIISNIKGHEGAWCQLCWLETLGPPLQSRMERMLLKPDHD